MRHKRKSSWISVLLDVSGLNEIIKTLEECARRLEKSRNSLDDSEEYGAKNLVENFQQLAREVERVRLYFQQYNSEHQNARSPDPKMDMFNQIVNQIVSEFAPATLLSRLPRVLDIGAFSYYSEKATASDVKVTLLSVSSRHVFSHDSSVDTFRNANTAPHPDTSFFHDFASLDDRGDPLTYEARLKAELLSTDTSTVNVTGEGGVGKTQALLALAHDHDIQSTFTGGVHFISLGVDATLNLLILQLSAVVEASGGKQLALALRRATNLQDALPFVRLWFHDHTCIFIFDDLHRTSTINERVIDQLQLLKTEKSETRLVLSTQDNSLLPSGTAIAFMPLAPRGNLAALILLRAAGAHPGELHRPTCEKPIQEILNICSGLPLALQLAGRCVHELRMADHSNQIGAWGKFWLMLSGSRARTGPTPSQESISPIVLSALDLLEQKSQRDLGPDGKTRLTYPQMFRALSVFQKQEEFSSSTVRRLWDLADEPSTVDIIETMHAAAVVGAKFVTHDNRRTATIRLHDLVYDVARIEAEKHGETALLIKKLLTILEKADPEIVEAALRTGRTKLDTVRLMVLGGPTRGKTSTLASLRGESFDENRESTRGVDLCISHLIPGNRDLHRNRFTEDTESDKFPAKFRNFSRSPYVPTVSQNAEEGQVESAPTMEGLRSEPEAISAPPASEIASDSVILMADSAIRYDTDLTQGTEGAHSFTKLRCWDFGGQREYEVAHELFISPHSIFMVVLNLQRFEDLEIRDSEIQELSHWLQTIFALTAEEDITGMAESVVLVGTRREAVPTERREGCIWDIRDMLVRSVGEKTAEALNVADMKIILLENKTAVSQPQNSGLLELEGHLETTARKIIESSQDVPLRWLAFLESLKDNEQEKRQYLESEDIASRMDGFFFPRSAFRREDELKAFLLYFRNLGELVLLSTARGYIRKEALKCAVFLQPLKILAALKTVIAPKNVRCDGLSVRSDRVLMSRGLISKQMLKTKWEKISCLSREEERQALLNLLTSLDLLLDLGGGLFGVPALLKSGWDDWGWMNSNSKKKEVSVVTLFDDYVPFGLVGTLIARIHRILGQGQKDIRYVRSNAVLLTLGLSDSSGVCQVFVGFNKGNRELYWKVRGNKYEFNVLGRCLQEFEAYKAERFNSVICSHRHLFLSECPRGCGQKGYRMEFPVPSLSLKLHGKQNEHWWETNRLAVETVSGLCNEAVCDNMDCLNNCSYAETMGASEPSASPGKLQTKQINVNPFVVFISHAGADRDKDWAEYMKTGFEKGGGPLTFVDRQALTGSHYYADDLMNKALDEAVVGVFILSPESFARKWTMYELRRFLERRDNGEEVVIYPIFHRLSYAEASCRNLHELEKFREVFFREKLFDTERGPQYEPRELIKAMRRLCRCSGLEKKLKGLHDESKRRDAKGYEERRKKREEAGERDVDWELGGVTLEEFFDFAVARVLEAYQRLRESQELG